ncbi:MAG: TonB-dependent receptor [Kiritimatiellae bacterium]|nr:TonB-dependent receptor [Kiritimatiellia bacterium]
MGKRLTFVLGGRYEYAGADADAVEDPLSGEEIQVDGHWNSLVGTGRLLCHLDEAKCCNLFVGVSQGFRAPNLSDLTRLDTARTDEIETPSPDLAPETYVSYELGVKVKRETLSAQIACFYTDIADMIVRTPTGRTIDGDYEVTKKNAGDGYLHGVEAEMRCALFADLSAFGGVTWTDGEVETYPTSDPVLVEEPMDRLMPPTGRLGLRWEGSGKYWVEGACTLAAKADKLSTRDEADTDRIPPGGTPGYIVADLRVGWRATADLTLSAAVENITDEDYRIHGSGVNEPGRNLVLAADWAF